MTSPIIKGILIGSSIGFMAAFFGFSDSLPRSVLLGTITGILAGITINKMIKHKQQNNKK